MHIPPQLIKKHENRGPSLSRQCGLTTIPTDLMQADIVARANEEDRSNVDEEELLRRTQNM